MHPHTLPTFLAPGFTRGFFRILIGCLCVLASASLMRAASATVKFSVTDDAYTWANDADTNFGAADLRARGTPGQARKEVFLRAVVDGMVISGHRTEVKKATLFLKQKTFVAGATTEVFSANNDWSEDALTHSTRPAVAASALASAANGDAASPWVAVDVTRYISGEGVYTFMVTSGAVLTDDVVYHSTEAVDPADRPYLEILMSNNAPDVTRNPNDIIVRGEEYIARYSDPADFNAVGRFDVTKQPYGAAPDDGVDDTLAIQRAINEARDARAVVYFPAGEYTVSKQLSMVSGIVTQAIITIPGHPANAERWSVEQFANQLMGPAAGARAKLRLVDGASEFGAPATPRPLIYGWSRRFNANQTADPKVNVPASNFNQTINNLDIDLGNNPGAIGISLSGAQGCIVADVTISASSAFAGFEGLPAPGGVYNATVLGGQYGVYTDTGDDAYTPSLTNCTFIGQTQNSISYRAGGCQMTLVGVRIEGKGIVANSTGNANPWSGNLCVVDSVIQLDTPGVAIQSNRSVYLHNVYTYNTQSNVRLGSVERLAGAPGWLRVREFGAGITIDQAPTYPPTTATVVKTWIDGEVRSELVDVLPGAMPPADLQSRHAMPKAPSLDDPDLVNVKTDFGASGNGVDDDQDNLQAAIDAAAVSGKKVFVPRGDYRLYRPLQLQPNTVLFGPSKHVARLKVSPATASGNTFNDGVPGAPVVRSAVGADVTHMIADLTVFQRIPDIHAYLIDWQAGRDSVVRDVNFDRRNVQIPGTMNRPLIKISGDGGGRWFNVWPITSSNQGANYRHVLIQNTSEPLSFYSLNPETDVPNVYQVEIANARNVDIYQMKLEGHLEATAQSSIAFLIRNSSNLRIFGLGGNYHPPVPQTATSPWRAAFEIENSDRYLIAMQSFQQRNDGTKPAALDYWQVREITSAGETVTTPGGEQFVVYRRGLTDSLVLPDVPREVNPATVTLNGLNAVYNGAAHPVTVTTDPAGLIVDVRYDGAPTPPTNAGTYAVTATVVNPYYVGSADGQLVIAPASASLSVSDLSYVYDGAAKPAPVVTVPAGLAHAVTYNGAAEAPSDAGSYAVVAVITDPNYVGAPATATLSILPAPASIALSGLQHVYDGAAKNALVTTTPAGIAASVTYNGGSALPVNAGSYAVVATLANPNYAAEPATGTLVISPMPVTIALGALTQTYDGLPKPALAETAPAGLPVALAYGGSASAPTYPGDYAVTATIADSNYAGSAAGLLRIRASVTTRHAPTISGDVDGSAHVLLPETVALNSTASMAGDLLIPGQPTVLAGAQAVYAGVLEGPGLATPTSHRVLLNGTAALRYVVRRVDPVAWPSVANALAPSGTRDVVVSAPGQDIGDPATLRNLTLSANAGDVALPPGAYGNVTLNNASRLVLGIAGSSEPVAYHFQRATLNGGAAIELVGPVVITVQNGVTAVGSAINALHAPEWLHLRLVAGDLTLNGAAVVHGFVVAPSRGVLLNGSTVLTGQVVSDRLVVGADALVQDPTLP